MKSKSSPNPFLISPLRKYPNPELGVEGMIPNVTIPPDSAAGTAVLRDF